MSRPLISSFWYCIERLECMIPQLFRGNEVAVNYALVYEPHSNLAAKTESHSGSRDRFSLKELLGDGILWAVPKHRRTVEKRLNRKFGIPDLTWKPLVPKATLRTCNQCGHDHELGVLCPHCYAKVKKETQIMQDKIQEELGLDPIDKEVVVLYDGEKTTEQLNKNLRIVEVNKPRPVWFSKNLLQKSTTPPADTKDVEPSKLG